MAISTAVSRFADYHRRKGCGATIRRAGTGTIETTNFCSALATAASPDATTSRWESRGRLILWPNELSVKVLREVSELEEIRREWESWPGNRDSDIHSYLTFLRSNPGTSRRMFWWCIAEEVQTQSWWDGLTGSGLSAEWAI